jgi:GNAT superfamily N-acetyltransferase
VQFLHGSEAAPRKPGAADRGAGDAVAVESAAAYNRRMIRAATPADFPTITRLIRALAEYERLADKVVFANDQLQQYLFGPRPYAEVLLAEDAGAVVGFALFFHNFSTFLGRPGIYLEDLFVEPDHRGRGHGKALLAALARLAVERNCGRVEWAVLDWNEPSIRFYKSLGAMPNSDWIVYRLQGPALESLAAHSPGA